MTLLHALQFHQVQGVHTLQLDLPSLPISVLVGANGVGKTKALECLHTALLSRHIDFLQWLGYIPLPTVYQTLLSTQVSQSYRDLLAATDTLADEHYRHNMPVVLLPSAQRVTPSSDVLVNVPALLQDQQAVQDDFFQLNQYWIEQGYNTDPTMGLSLAQWFLDNLYSRNPYVDQQQWYDHDVATVLAIAQMIEPTIDADMQSVHIANNQVILRIAGQERALQHLSSGYTSLLRLIQGIVAGYRAFQVQGDIRQVSGYVLIDQIELCLHEDWQTRLLPVLHQAFPHTRFIVTTQSMTAAAYHGVGAVYLLERYQDGVLSLRLNQP